MDLPKHMNLLKLGYILNRTRGRGRVKVTNIVIKNLD